MPVRRHAAEAEEDEGIENVEHADGQRPEKKCAPGAHRFDHRQLLMVKMSWTGSRLDREQVRVLAG